MANETDCCGICNKTGADTWTVETPEDFGWECENDCTEHVFCSNCGAGL